MTRTEKLVKAFALLQQGYAPKEIAKLVGVTPRTIKNWQARYTKKVSKANRNLIDLTNLHIKNLKSKIQNPDLSAHEIYNLTKALINLTQIVKEYARQNGLNNDIPERQRQRIKAFELLQQGYTQKEVAKLVGVGEKTISDWKKKYQALNLTQIPHTAFLMIDNKLKHNDLTPDDIHKLLSSYYMLNIILTKYAKSSLTITKKPETTPKNPEKPRK